MKENIERSENKTFEYNGSEITFQLGKGDTMVNATQMAKPFGKRPVDWLQNNQTQEFLYELSEVRKSTSADLVKVIKGGRLTQGTWMHKDVAVEFARWLSPMFAIWCNDRIFELMKYGFTATDQTLDRLIAQPERGVELFTALKEEREKHAAELKNEQECSKLQWAMCVDQGKYIQELRESALIQKISERRYLFVAIEQQRLLKQNNIPIPTNLKISRRLYERDLKRLKI